MLRDTVKFKLRMQFKGVGLMVSGHHKVPAFRDTLGTQWCVLDVSG